MLNKCLDIFACFYLLFSLFIGKKMFHRWKRWFEPTNSEQSTCSLVQIHNNDISFVYNYLSQVQNWRVEIFCPAVGTFGADVSGLPVSVHDGLKDRCERSDTNSSADQNCMLGSENLACRGTKRTVNVNLKKFTSPMIILVFLKMLFPKGNHD